jgi:hypothetical protein
MAALAVTMRAPASGKFVHSLALAATLSLKPL